MDWYSATTQALQGLWQGFLNFIPLLIVAIIVFIIGWFLSIGAGKVITEILKKIKFNQIFEKGGWKTALEKADFKVDAAGFIGAIVKWVLVIVFLQIAVSILGWKQFAFLLESVVGYIPNVIVAALIFVVTVILVDIIEKIVRATVEGFRVGYGHMISAIVKWGIWIFVIVIILDQLNIGGILPQTIIFGFIAFLALSAGLAFGLGGKEVAAEILQNLKKKLKD